MHNLLSDEKLMVRFVWHNDPESFGQLVARWDKRVIAFLAKASGDPHEAKDLRQEVFIRVYKHAATFDSNQKFSTWLFSIVRNVLATWYTKKKRRGLIELPQRFDAALSTVGNSPTPSTEAIAAEHKVVIDGAIARLKPCERELLLLRMDLDMSYREIGEILDTAESTVKSRMYTLLLRMRKNLKSSPLSIEAGELEQCERIP